MDEPLQIVFDNVEPDPAIKTLIEEKSKKLERFYDHMTDATVIISQASKRQNTGNEYHVTLEANVPGKRLVVSNSPGRRIRHEALRPTINDAFNAMIRQLEDYARKQRGDIKQHDLPLEGRIRQIFAEEGYGFIALIDGRDVYFHKNSVIGKGFENLSENTPVRVVLAYDESPDGPQATTVEAVSEMQFTSETDRLARQ